jgi:hypothetical protein
MADLLWYKDVIIYEVHVRSFFDSGDDGMGDFADPYARWCGRGRRVTAAPMPINERFLGWVCADEKGGGNTKCVRSS